MKLSGSSQSVKGAILAASDSSFEAGSGAAGMADVCEMQVGEYTGNGGTPQDVLLDFVPTSVEVYNQTTGGISCFALNTASVGANSWKLKAGTQSFAANCITFTANTKKFTVGSDSDLNTNAVVYSFVAQGS